jgi:hypothetical protein
MVSFDEMGISPVKTRHLKVFCLKEEGKVAAMRTTEGFS